MDSEIEEMINKAEKLRGKRKGIMSLFSSPDYFESADLFIEAGKKCIGLEKKEKCYIEAIDTLRIKKSEYAFFRIAEVYRMLIDMSKECGDEERIQNYMKEYARALESSGRYLVSGQAYSKLAEVVGSENASDGIEYYEKAIDMFSKDGECPYHIQDVRKKLLIYQLKAQNYEAAYNNLSRLPVTFSGLCRQILCIILERPLEGDPENDLIMTLINGTGDDCVEALRKFRDNHHLPEYASMIFQTAEERLSPENDIC